MGALSDEAVKEYCEDLDSRHTVLVGFFCDGVLRGLAEVNVPDSRFPILSEIAVTVETAWQDHGVATELLRRALAVARNRSVRGVHVTCVGHNSRIQRIAEKFGARFQCKDGECEADMAIAAPTYASLCEEAIDDGFGWMNLWIDHMVLTTRRGVDLILRQ